jgi:formiminotetrahydrofolate cyclodeaminase
VIDTLFATIEEESAWPEIGPTAGLVVALCAVVLGESARRSGDSWEEAGGAVAQAAALRARAARLAREDLDAHLAATEAIGAALEGQQAGADGPLAAALARAADLPLEIAEAAADASLLGALVAENGNPDLRADAAGAAALAAGAVGAAAHLIEVNLATVPDDERLARARELIVAAAAASERARAAS